MFPVIKQVEEKNLANEIDILLWSDRMDLLALSNIKGEVALHRLSWSRAWSLGPPKEGYRVKGLAWRPDGRVLAIAYCTGDVLLIDVENKNTLHKIQIEGNISCIFWIRDKNDSQNSDDEDVISTSKFSDSSCKYLPDLPPISSLGPSVTALQDDNPNSNLFHDQKELNFLIIGTESGYLHISIFGQFPCATLNLNDYVGHNCSILSAHLSEDLDLMFITIRDDLNIVKVIIFNTKIFKTHAKELFAIALKHGHINSLITYLSNTILPIKETLETVLLEMDEKLSKYASRVSEGTISADFLDLLMFGIISDDLHEFLLNDLTEKGLKKFGQVTEMCYSNIQKLLLKHVMKAGQNIIYHLTELRGMSQMAHSYKVLGLSEEPIMESIAAGGAFLTKAGEMLEIIDHFTINYKAFFRWLYAAIVHLMDVQLLPEMPKTTEQDVDNIIEFVLNFDKIKSAKNRGKFIMERLGQYLNDSPLTIPNKDDSLWENFLQQNECIQKHPGMIKRYKNYSFVQQFKHLVLSIENIFVRTKELVARQFSFKRVLSCVAFDGEHLPITKSNFSNHSTILSFLNKSPPADGIYLLEISYNPEINASGCYFYFEQSASNNYLVVDAIFYSPSILSVLLQENGSNKMGAFYQFSITNAREKFIPVDPKSEACIRAVPKINGLDLELGAFKQIEGMVCSNFAVSGCRRVSVVLSENRKKVRLFEMEAEEDEEDDADMTNSARESDASMQEDVSLAE